ncbi:hypothetical protein HW555_007567 [Spodoptera exigua]|uniref:Uncharacterized protein n=1 Tax=Spodoptera exigua TaxID=7107 RepID=A0A835GGJ4_SPOEX|nr:hypothetical protein HW555_007567 [Spodoptera exigua]
MRNSYQDLKYSSLISQPMLSIIIPETCSAIYTCLEHYIKLDVISKLSMTLMNTGLAYTGKSLARSLHSLSRSRLPSTSTIPHIPALPSVLGTCGEKIGTIFKIP